jgi:hypothetical protein
MAAKIVVGESCDVVLFDPAALAGLTVGYPGTERAFSARPRSLVDEVRRGNAMILDGLAAPAPGEGTEEPEIEVRVGEAPPPIVGPGETSQRRRLRLPSGRLHCVATGPEVLLAEVPPGFYEVEARWRDFDVLPEDLLDEADQTLLARHRRRGLGLLGAGIGAGAAASGLLLGGHRGAPVAILYFVFCAAFALIPRHRSCGRREPLRSALARLALAAERVREIESAPAPPLRLWLRRLDGEPPAPPDPTPRAGPDAGVGQGGAGGR